MFYISRRPFVIPSGGGSAVTLDQASTEQGTSTSPLVNNNHTVAGGLTNPALLLVIVNAGATSMTSVTAVWDFGGAPQSMTLLKDQNAGSGRQVMIFGLRNPASGNKQLRVDYSGASNAVFCAAMSFSHVNPASDAAAFPNATGASTGATPISITITTGANNYGVAGYSSQTNFSSVSDNQLFLDNTGSVWAAAANYAASSGASVTLTGSPGNVNSTTAGICVAHD